MSYYVFGSRAEMFDPLSSAPYTMSEIKRLWREPRSTGRTALNMVRFAEMSLKGRATCQTQN